jgi:hypothetical protein
MISSTELLLGKLTAAGEVVLTFNVRPWQISPVPSKWKSRYTDLNIHLRLTSPGTLSLGVKRPGREADHSPPFSAMVKECVELYLYSPNTPSWRGAHLKHRDSFTFTFYV